MCPKTTGLAEEMLAWLNQKVRMPEDDIRPRIRPLITMADRYNPSSDPPYPMP